jgi:5-methylcytosine-specific restriction endonuclease McrA
MPINWRLWFRTGDVLETEFRHDPFRITRFNPESISVECKNRTEPGVELHLDRLNALAAARTAVNQALANGDRLTQTVNSVWVAAGLGNDFQNESQYWALVCERARRRRRAVRINMTFREGGRVLYTLSRAERNPALRRACIERYGLKCSVCNFDFEGIFGVVGRGYIQIHHLDPLAATSRVREVRVDRLVPVCANCHVMLHQRTPPYTPEELKAMM